jgi:hypothetical protein
VRTPQEPSSKSPRRIQSFPTWVHRTLPVRGSGLRRFCPPWFHSLDSSGRTQTAPGTTLEGASVAFRSYSSRQGQARPLNLIRHFGNFLWTLFVIWLRVTSSGKTYQLTRLYFCLSFLRQANHMSRDFLPQEEPGQEKSSRLHRRHGLRRRLVLGKDSQNPPPTSFFYFHLTPSWGRSLFRPGVRAHRPSI